MALVRVGEGALTAAAAAVAAAIKAADDAEQEEEDEEEDDDDVMDSVSEPACEGVLTWRIRLGAAGSLVAEREAGCGSD